ncbi:MAG: ABC transporter permease, partial [Gammaproteobacteria bacterium]|nr:ABC transporter permease [Gammaproteobacteria bacterium]
MRFSRIRVLAFKEWREIMRDRLFLTLAFVVPSVLMLVFGYGIILDVEKLPFAVLDQDRSEMSRDYVHQFMASRYFDYQGSVQSEDELSDLLADSKIRLALIIPQKFQQRLSAGQPAPVQTLIDGTFPFRAQTAKGYAIAINASTNADLLARFVARTQGITLQRAAAMVSPVRLELRYLYNQELNSRWSVAAALIMFIL